MPTDLKPIGQRFSQVYLSRGAAVGDSTRMRVRLQSMLGGKEYFWRKVMAPHLTNELGVYVDDHFQFLIKCELRDVFDSVTLVYRYFSNSAQTQNATLWREFVARILKEENLQYVIDEHGGVHFNPDQEYAHNAAATLSVLANTRYANVLDAFNNGLNAMRSAPPDGKGGIRQIFAAAEGLFRLLLPNAHRLGAKEAEALRVLIQKKYANDPTALRSSEKLLNGFKEWVDAAHFYRHEEGRPDEVAQPPIALAINLTSIGASNVRWLTELDAG